MTIEDAWRLFAWLRIATKDQVHKGKPLNLAAYTSGG